MQRHNRDVQKQNGDLQDDERSKPFLAFEIQEIFSENGLKDTNSFDQ